jgi:hypothetical protein
MFLTAIASYSWQLAIHKATAFAIRPDPTVLQVINASFIDLQTSQQSITQSCRVQSHVFINNDLQRYYTFFKHLLHIYYTFAQPTGSPKDSPSPRKQFATVWLQNRLRARWSYEFVVFCSNAIEVVKVLSSTCNCRCATANSGCK